MTANPEAIAWYLQKSEGFLGELRDQAQSLRSRGGRLAGFSGAVLALAGANADSILGLLHGLARVAAGTSLLLGSLWLIASLALALRGTLLPELVSDASVEEVADYPSDRFTQEPDLWRVQVRAIRGSASSIELMAAQVDEAARTARKAEYFFLAGLFAVGVAFGTLIAVVTF